MKEAPTSSATLSSEDFVFESSFYHASNRRKMMSVLFMDFDAAEDFKYDMLDNLGHCRIFDRSSDPFSAYSSCQWFFLKKFEDINSKKMILFRQSLDLFMNTTFTNDNKS